MFIFEISANVSFSGGITASSVVAPEVGILLRLGVSCTLGLPAIDVMVSDVSSTYATNLRPPVSLSLDAASPVNAADGTCSEVGGARLLLSVGIRGDSHGGARAVQGGSGGGCAASTDALTPTTTASLVVLVNATPVGASAVASNLATLFSAPPNSTLLNAFIVAAASRSGVPSSCVLASLQSQPSVQSSDTLLLPSTSVQGQRNTVRSQASEGPLAPAVVGGIAVASVLCCCAVIAAVFFVRTRRRRNAALKSKVDVPEHYGHGFSSPGGSVRYMTHRSQPPQPPNGEPGARPLQKSRSVWRLTAPFMSKAANVQAPHKTHPKSSNDGSDAKASVPSTPQVFSFSNALHADAEAEFGAVDSSTTLPKERLRMPSDPSRPSPLGSASVLTATSGVNPLHEASPSHRRASMPAPVRRLHSASNRESGTATNSAQSKVGDTVGSMNPLVAGAAGRNSPSMVAVRRRLQRNTSTFGERPEAFSDPPSQDGMMDNPLAWLQRSTEAARRVLQLQMDRSGSDQAAGSEPPTTPDPANPHEPQRVTGEPFQHDNPLRNARMSVRPSPALTGSSEVPSSSASPQLLPTMARRPRHTGLQLHRIAEAETEVGAAVLGMASPITVRRNVGRASTSTLSPRLSTMQRSQRASVQPQQSLVAHEQESALPPARGGSLYPGGSIENPFYLRSRRLTQTPKYRSPG